MAALKKTVAIDGNKYEVREIIVQEMLDIKKIVGGLSNMSDIVTNIDKILPYCSTVTQDDLVKMAPSDIETLWKAFKEVNSVFFSTIQTFGLVEVAERIKMNLTEIFLQQSFRLMQNGRE